MAERIETVCPCCEARLVVDVESGEILSAQRPAPDRERTFDAAVEQVRSGAERREDAFSKAFRRTQKLDDLLGKKFDEARKKARDEPDKPRSPFDAD